MLHLYTRGCALTNLFDAASRIASCRKAAIFADEWAAVDTANVQGRMSATSAHHGLAGALIDRGDLSGMGQRRRAVEMAGQFFATNRICPPLAAWLPSSINSSASRKWIGAIRPARCPNCAKAIDLREPLLLHPAGKRPRVWQAGAFSVIGEIQWRAKNWKDAFQAYGEAKNLYAPLDAQGGLDARSHRDFERAKERADEFRKRL